MNWLIIMSRKRFGQITRDIAKEVALTAWNAGREYQYHIDKGEGVILAGSPMYLKVPKVWTDAWEKKNE